MSLQEILRYISLLLAMQPPPLERPDFADDAMTPPAEQARPHLLRTGPSLTRLLLAASSAVVSLSQTGQYLLRTGYGIDKEVIAWICTGLSKVLKAVL